MALALAFRAHQDHVLLELRAHQKRVLSELRAQQTAQFEPKVVILAIFIRKTVNKVKLLNLKYYIHNFGNGNGNGNVAEEKYFMS